MAQVHALVVGAGPVGLTAALELRRRGVGCRIVDRLAAPNQVGKAVGIQPRTLEIWEAAGLMRDALDAATPLRGQHVYVNGKQVAQLELTLPPEVPFGFVALPQYDTERMLTEHLQRHDTSVERGVELISFEQDADGVAAHLNGPDGPETVHAAYLVGCDGAHSIVRHGLDLNFAGDAFPEGYVLGDVQVDWSRPPGYVIRATHQSDGKVDDLLVCIPLPGWKRYRMSMLVPPELATQPRSAGEVAHGLEGGQAPQLHHIQAVLDRLAPEPTTASHLRWSSIFRISHRIVEHYGRGRVFLAGDAAHIHPPTGAQGMNTGIQDAYNLAWKLALVVKGSADTELLDSYDAERRPVGEEVVGRTVRHARAGFEGDPDDPSTIILREAQLLVGYPDSPIVHEDNAGDLRTAGPRPGQRAPDCRGLQRDTTSFPLRLFELLDGTEHTLMLYADNDKEATALADVATAVTERTNGHLRPYLIVSQASEIPNPAVPTLRDTAGEYRAAYDATSGCAYLIRPDGYLAYRTAHADTAHVLACLETVLPGFVSTPAHT